jgi:hypothetical protein
LTKLLKEEFEACNMLVNEEQITSIINLMQSAINRGHASNEHTNCSVDGGSHVPLDPETMIRYAFRLRDKCLAHNLQDVNLFRIGVGYGEEAVALKAILDILNMGCNLIGIELNKGNF